MPLVVHVVGEVYRNLHSFARVHYRHLWRGARTATEYVVDTLRSDADRKLEKAIPSLITELKKLPEGRELKFRGSHPLESGPRVFHSVSFERSYRDASQQWRYSRYFDLNDLGKVVSAAQQGAGYIQGLEQAAK